MKDNLARTNDLIRLASRQIRELREENSHLKLKVEGLQKELEEFRVGKNAEVHRSADEWTRNKREIRKRIEMIRERISVLEENPLGRSN